MAVIIKVEGAEKGNYQRIIAERCFANADGLYLATAVYKSRADREKEKSRKPEILGFISNFRSRYAEIDTIDDETLRESESLKLDRVARVVDVLDGLIYITDATVMSERFSVSEEDAEEAEKYGFKMSWYDDPIHILRYDIMRVDDYKRQEFTPESFYSSLKEKIYTSPSGELLVEDDL